VVGARQVAATGEVPEPEGGGGGRDEQGSIEGPHQRGAGFGAARREFETMRDRVEIQHDIRGGHWGAAGKLGPIGGEIRDELYRYLPEMPVRLLGLTKFSSNSRGVGGLAWAVLVRQVSVDGWLRIRLLWTSVETSALRFLGSVPWRLW
jgi:hypothetical protein